METRYDENQLLTFIQAMANVAAADGRVTDEERDQLDDMILGLGMKPGDAEVQRVIEAEFKSPGDLNAIVGRLQSRELKAALVRMMIEVSCSDGEIAAEERAAVAGAAKTFGFDPALIDDLIAWALESVRLEAREAELMGRLMN